MVESALSGYNNQQVFILDSLLHSASLLLLFIVGDFLVEFSIPLRIKW